MTHDGPTALPASDALAHVGAGPWRHLDTIQDLVLADGDRCIVCCDGSHTRMWDAETGVLRAEFRDGAASLATSPDGSRVVTAGFESSVYDVSSGGAQLLEVEDSAAGYPKCACFLLDRDELVGATSKGELVRWSLADGAVLERQPHAPGRTRAIIAHPEAIFSLTGESLFVTNAESLDKRHRWTCEQSITPSAIAYRSGTEPLLAIGSTLGSVVLADPSDGRTLRVIEALPNLIEVTSLTFGGQGDQLAVGGRDGRIRVWDLATDDFAEIRPSCVPVKAVALSHDGALLAAAIGAAVRRWGLPDCQLLDHQVAHLAAIAQVGFDPTGERFTSQSRDGVWTWDLHTWRPRHGLRYAKRQCAGFGFRPEGGLHVALVSHGRLAIDCIDEGGAKERLATFEDGPATGKEARWSPDGRTLAWTRRWTLYRYGVERNSPTKWTSAHSAADFAWSSASDRMACCQSNGTVKLCSTNSNEELRLQAFKRSASSVALCPPHGQILATGTLFYHAEDNLRFWDPSTEQRLAEMPAGESTRHLAWSPDGRVLAGASHDRVVLWEPRRLAEFCQLSADARVTALGFSPTGQLLAVGLGDGTSLIWDLHEQPGPWVAVQRCQQLQRLLRTRYQRGTAGPYRSGPIPPDDQRHLLLVPAAAGLVVADAAGAVRLDLVSRLAGYTVILTDDRTRSLPALLETPWSPMTLPPPSDSRGWAGRLLHRLKGPPTMVTDEQDTVDHLSAEAELSAEATQARCIDGALTASWQVATLPTAPQLAGLLDAFRRACPPHANR